MNTPPKIAIIAGETSGDQLGGWLMEAIKKQQSYVQFIGVGGERMQAQGLRSIFPMQEISLMGVFEILPHIFTIKRRLKETIRALIQEKPDVVVTIDSPGFNFRIAKALRATGAACPKLIHYVAPSVWSHRPERAKKVATLYDEQLVLFPFEPPYFEKEGLKTTFIGHQVAWEWKSRGDGEAFRKRHRMDQDAPLLAVFPGSRQGELNRMLPVIRTTIEKIHRILPTLRVAIQVPSALKARLEAETSDWMCVPLILTSLEEKKDLFAAATAALAKSGTIAIECALAGLPAVVTYKANPLSVWLVRRLILIQYVHIANLMANRAIIPEFLQEDCTPEKLSSALMPLLTGEPARSQQVSALKQFSNDLGAEDAQSPSDKAASIILGSF